VQQLPFRILSQSVASFAFMLLCSTPAPPHSPWLRSVILISFRLRKRSIWCVACLGGARQGSPEESVPALPPWRSRRRGVCVVHLLHFLRVGAADFALLPATAGGVWALASTPHTPLHAPGSDLRPPLQDVRRCAPCTSLFRYFFVLVRSGKTRDHIGAYYFQTRPNLTIVYIPTFGGARWENWRSDWVIASTEANDRLILPTALDHKQWRTKPSLSPEFLPVLDRIKVLATGGLTSMHVVGDLLKRRIAPLQKRPRLSYWFIGPNDICRIQRGPGTDLSWDELELLVGGLLGRLLSLNP
jgi:hypothetical protein